MDITTFSDVFGMSFYITKADIVYYFLTYAAGRELPGNDKMVDF